MLKLHGIKKDYGTKPNIVQALKGVSLEFRQSEFVCVLGPSGCGKTTMLNIIGGLDRYTSGDLLINDKSTKHFTDRDWDSYRNNTIGFVFQNYNLIGHTSVLANVEIALTLSGVSAGERKRHATQALDKVGLSDQLYKKPNQLSGGQMQRVAIARALVNNPKILLADEPTGALDSETSIQIMELLKEISHDRLVIMVTHNNEIAYKYSTRTVKLLDGEITYDSNPYKKEQEPTLSASVKKQKYSGGRKTSMTFFTALKLSFNNLKTKRTRTMITALAGSIGIIGIALVLAISSGMTAYVNRMQSETLSNFPVTIGQIVPNFSLETMQQMADTSNDFPKGDLINVYDSESDNKLLHYNTFTQEYFDYIEKLDSGLYNAVSYTRNIKINLVAKTADGYELVENEKSTSILSGGSAKDNIGWQEVPPSEEFVKGQYDLLAGEYPSSAGDLVLILDSKNRVDSKLLRQFGIEFDKETTFSFSDFLGKEIRQINNNRFYTKDTITGLYSKNNDYSEMYNDVTQRMLKISCILRVKPDVQLGILSRGIGYTVNLTDTVLAENLESDICAEQKDNMVKNLITGDPFGTDPAESILNHKAFMAKLGGTAEPSGISIYPNSFENKAEIKKYLDAYNTGKSNGEMILYSDLAETASKSVETLISTISIILSAFAGISLVVSSIMIGIITYVSVVERTKEIGILRSIGARKKDISRVFNAETVLIGFAAGFLGVVIAYMLSLAVNAVIFSLVKVQGIAALPLSTAIVLVLISVALTFIAGLIPSRIAAKKDPVAALRSE